MTSKTFAISRAIGVIGATAVMATGVTFAALTSNVATLSNNSIAETTAQLRVFDPVSGYVTTTATGFTVTGLIPGTESAPKAIYLKNQGNAALTLSAHATGASSWSGLSDYADLKVKIKDLHDQTETETTMALLLGGNVNLTTPSLPVGAEGSGGADVAGNYAITFEIAPDKVTGSSLSVGSFNLEFTGSVQ